MKIRWVFAFALCASISAHADTLFIISSAGGLFGTKQANLAMEKFGSEVVKGAIGEHYRRVYVWNSEAAPPLKLFAKAVAHDQKNGERLDVFAMKHSSESLLPGLSKEEVENIFPKGLIRRVYTTGCSDWGTFTAAIDGRGIKASQYGYSEHLKRLGAEEYVIHANDNYTGPISLPLELSEIRGGGSWIEGMKRAFTRLDEMSAVALPDVRRLDQVLKDLAGLDKLPLTYASAEESLLYYFASRPVFGGSRFGSYANEFIGKNMLSSNDEAMLSPAPSLVPLLARYYPKAFESLSCRDGACPAPAALPKGRSAMGPGVMALMGLIQKIVAAYAGDEDGCLNTKVLQPLVTSFLNTKDRYAPELQKFCVQKTGRNEYTIEWKLGPTIRGYYTQRSGGYVDEGLDFWEGILVPGGVGVVELSPPYKLKDLTLERHGSITISTSGKNTDIDIRGIGVNLTGGLPDDLLHFSVNGARASDLDGEFAVRVGAPLFAIPVKAEGRLSKGVANLSDAKILGIKFKIR